MYYPGALEEEQLIYKLSLSPPFSEIVWAVTWDIFCCVTEKLGRLVSLEVDHKIVVFIITSVISSACTAPLMCSC